MITIEYAEHGEPISDFNYIQWLDKVKSYIRVRDYKFVVSTSLPISVIQLAVVKGEISANEVVFLYKDTVIKINHYGNIENWPKRFADILCRTSESILLNAFVVRRKEREEKVLKV